MVTVSQIRPASGGFGEFELSEGLQFSAETVAEYCTFVMQENSLVRLYSTDEEDSGDEDGDRLAAAIRERNGRIRGQGNGTIVAFLMGDEVFCELVCEDDPVTVADPDCPICRQLAGLD